MDASQIDISEFKNPEKNNLANAEVVKEIIPGKVFIVPYRDREPHKLVFTRVMPYILGDLNYRILF